ncbi:MAG: hypothetical protein ABSG91_03865 [Syntrophobacteraceae bacterium]|jgi:hypothetical protein
MKLFVCGTEATREIVATLDQVIKEAIPERYITIFHSIELFSSRLSELDGGADMAVLVVADRSELQRFVALREFLEESRIILVLPESMSEDTTEAQALLPRFISFASTLRPKKHLCEAEDLSTVGIVLRNMVKTFEPDSYPG